MEMENVATNSIENVSYRPLTNRKNSRKYEMEGNSATENVRNLELNTQKSSINSLSTTFLALIFVLFLFGLCSLTIYLANILPTPLSIVDEKLYPDAFITERAKENLEKLTSIGPRVVGFNENEVLAVNFLKTEIQLIQDKAHSNHKLEVDVQHVSGSFFLDFKPGGFIDSYANIQNVIVKLHSKNNSLHSLLVNAHFDSVPTSPGIEGVHIVHGGSDDGINCVVMLEILRKLTQSPVQPENNIIFLFNGAEESPLVAAHGFITHHKWASEVRVVINLEAAGSGYKEFLFQAGPEWPWLLNYYGKVPHPNGQAAGEELFQTGLIPSGTDFRIFRDFGNLIGMDFAFIKNGYRYHTKFDDFSSIPLGSYQHVGDNALSLVRNLANAPELQNLKMQSKSSPVFFDYMGVFFIHYSGTVAIIVNVVVSLVSAIIAIKSIYDYGLSCSYQSMLYLVLTTAGILFGWLSGVVFAILIATILDLLNFTMSWYSSPWILYGLYVTPTIAFCCLSITIFNYIYSKNDKSYLSLNSQAQVQGHLLRLIWSIPLLIGTILRIRAVYLILMPLIFQTLTASIILIFCLQYKRRWWVIIYILGTIVPNINIMKSSYDIISLLIPVCGRIGSDKNPEMYIGALVALQTILITSYYTALTTLIRKRILFIVSLFAVFLVFFVMVFTPLGFPYSANPISPAPQRFWIYHTSRTFHKDNNEVFKKDAGFHLLNMDRNSPNSVRNYVDDLNKAESIEDDCNTSVFCGLSIPSPRAISILKESTWIPAEEPQFDEAINLTLNSKTIINETVRRFNFTASGPNSLNLYISPKEEVALINISLAMEIQKAATWNGRPVYVIVYTCGAETVPLTFSVDFKLSSNWRDSTLFDIALIGSYKYDKYNNNTVHFDQFLNDFPGWTDVTPWLVAYESWVY